MTEPEPSRAQIEARMLRLRAAHARAKAASFEATAQVILLGETMQSLAAAFAASEAKDIAEHPDLAELNVQLDGFYGAT